MQLEFMVGVFEFVLLIFSLSFHECAHAWMASRLGDQTARMQGRVTLNPMNHVDPIGTLIFPAIAIFGPMIGIGMFAGLLIGWAKPTLCAIVLSSGRQHGHRLRSFACGVYRVGGDFDSSARRARNGARHFF